MIYLFIVHLTYSSADQLESYWKQMYPNYNINIVDSKEMVADSLDGKLPHIQNPEATICLTDNGQGQRTDIHPAGNGHDSRGETGLNRKISEADSIILLTDSDQGQQLLHKTFPTCPMIGWLHKDGPSESLMACPHLIMDKEALSPGYLDALYHHHYHLPLQITETDSFYIRELCMEDFSALDLLQSENESHPDGCFFPAGLTRDERMAFLKDYIHHQYPFFGYGLYAIVTAEEWAGIAGFSSMTEYEDYLPVSYTLLKKHQGKGLARQAVSSLSTYAFHELEVEAIYTKTDKNNKPSIQVMVACNFTLWQEQEDYLYWLKKCAR